MTEYHSSASINRIIAAPAGYVGSDSHAELPFDALETNPYQIILLDEFEKCNKSVQRLFMSAFDEGYIKTNKGKTIDFSKSIIIATTNAAHESNSTGSIGFTNSSSGNKTRATVEKLSDYFDIALLNRFEHILTFNPISKEVYTDILAENYKSEIARIKANKRNIMLSDELSEDELAKLADETYVPEFGARPVKKTIRSYIESNT
jgi:ATP-dependent Clp protease ATP-binding subunit ClpA